MAWRAATSASIAAFIRFKTARTRAMARRASGRRRFWRRGGASLMPCKRLSRMQFHDAFSLTLFEAEALLAGDVARKSSRLRGAAKWRVV